MARVRRRPGAAGRPAGPTTAPGRASGPARPGEPDQYSPVGHGAEHRRPGRDLGVLADVGAGAEHAAGADPGPAPTRTGPMCSTSPSSQCPLRSTSGSIEHPSPSVSIPVTGGMRVQVDVACRPRRRAAARTTVMYGAPGQLGGAQLVGQALGQPQPQVHLAAARVVARRRPAQQEPGAGRGEQHPARRRDEDQPAESEQPPGRLREQGPARAPSPSSVVADRHPGQPAQAGQGAQRHVATTWPTWVLSGVGRTVAVASAGPATVELVEVGGQGADGRVLVDVGDRDLGEALAQPGHHLGGGEAAAAEVEEVVGRGPDVGAEDARARARRATPAVPCSPRSSGVRGRGRAAATAGRPGRPCRRSGSAGRRPPPAGAPARRASSAGAAPCAWAWSKRRVDRRRSRRAAGCPPRSCAPRPRPRPPRAARAARCRSRRARSAGRRA